MTAPTATQQQTLAIIASLTLLHGRAPTHRQIADATGVGREAITKRLAWMRKKGLLRVRHERWSPTSGLTRAGAGAVASALLAAV